MTGRQKVGFFVAGLLPALWLLCGLFIWILEPFKYDSYIRSNIKLLTSINTYSLSGRTYFRYLDNIKKYVSFGNGAWNIEDSIFIEIDSIPTADVVEVVRCADCKHSYDSLAGWICSYGVCVDCVVRDDFYCSYAERRQDG